MSDVPPSEATLGELVADVGRDVSTLVRKELELAKMEARSEAATFVRSLGAFAAAGVAALACLLMASTALALWIAEELHVAVSFAIVGAVWLVVALVAYGAARSAMQRIRPMPETTDAIKSAIHGDSLDGDRNPSISYRRDDVVVAPTHQISDSRRTVGKEAR
jgi:uncharacterized membrane protein YqjE